jgi:hypothetical protein
MCDRLLAIGEGAMALGFKEQLAKILLWVL